MIAQGVAAEGGKPWGNDPLRDQALKERDNLRNLQNYKQDRNNNLGFSLTEILVALFIFSTALLGTFQMYNVGLDKIRTVRESAKALQLVVNQVETVRAMPFAELTERDKAPFIGPEMDLDGLAKATPALTIRSFGEPGLNLKEVTASLSWTGENGRRIEKKITTLVGRRGQ